MVMTRRCWFQPMPDTPVLSGRAIAGGVRGGAWFSSGSARKTTVARMSRNEILAVVVGLSDGRTDGRTAAARHGTACRRIDSTDERRRRRRLLARRALTRLNVYRWGKVNNNNNNNNQDDIYDAVIMAQPLREFTRFIWWMQTQRRGGRQPTDQANRLGLRVRQKEMAATVHIHHRHFIITQPESWYSFYRPTKGGRLSWPRYSKVYVDLYSAPS